MTPISAGSKPPKNCLIIDNVALSIPPGYPEPEWAVHNAVDALMAILRHPASSILVEKHGLRAGVWQDWMMFLLPHVAKHFCVDHNEVLEKWFKEWGTSILLGSNVPIFGYIPGPPLVGVAEALTEWEKRYGRRND